VYLFQSNLLICDVCDEEYHTTCLKPPLTHVPKSRRWLCTNCRTKEKDGVKVSLRGRSAIKPSQVIVTERDSSMGSSERRRSSGRVANLDSTKKETSEEKKIPVRSTRGESTLEKNHVQTQGIDRRQSINVASSSNSPQLSEGKSNIASRTIHKKVNTSRDTTKPMDTVSESIGTKQIHISPKQKLSIEKVKAESSIPTEVLAQEIRPPVLDPNTSNGKALIILEETKENESTLIPPPKAVQRSRSGRMVKQSRFHDELHEGEQHLKSGKGQNLVSPPNHESESTKKPIVIGKVPPREITIERNSELPKALVESIEVPKDAEMKNVLTVNNAEISQLKSQSSEIETPSVTLISEPPVKTLNEKAVISALSNESVPTIAITTTKISRTPLDANLIVKPDVPPSSTVPTPVDSQIKSVNHPLSENQALSRVPRRKPGARECMQISRKFGAQVIPTKYIQILLVRIHLSYECISVYYHI
jgi:PHD-finger